jgi:hypothetical protein
MPSHAGAHARADGVHTVGVQAVMAAGHAKDAYNDKVKRIDETAMCAATFHTHTIQRRALTRSN